MSDKPEWKEFEERVTDVYIPDEYPEEEGWVNFEQLTLESGARPDNVVVNEVTRESVIVDAKDKGRLTFDDVDKVCADMDEFEADRGELVVASDTQISENLEKYAEDNGIDIVVTDWRSDEEEDDDDY